MFWGSKRLVFLGTPTLETKRLILRRLKPSDAKAVFEYASDPEVTKYVTWQPHKAIAESKSFIRFVLNQYKQDKAGDWAIVLRQTGKVIGTCGFTAINAINNYAEIGYVLSHRYWGNGYMTEAVLALLKFAFDKMSLNRVEAVHILNNAPSGRVMEKAGMKSEGLLQQRIFTAGEYHDVRIYAITKKEYYRTLK